MTFHRSTSCLLIIHGRPHERAIDVNRELQGCGMSNYGISMAKGGQVRTRLRLAPCQSTSSLTERDFIPPAEKVHLGCVALQATPGNASHSTVLPKGPLDDDWTQAPMASWRASPRCRCKGTRQCQMQHERRSGGRMIAPPRGREAQDHTLLPLLLFTVCRSDPPATPTHPPLLT